MTKKKIILCVTLITLSIFSIFAFKSFQKYQKQYTGKQWYERQSDYIDDLSVYTGEMDDIFSLGGSDHHKAAPDFDIVWTLFCRHQAQVPFFLTYTHTSVALYSLFSTFLIIIYFFCSDVNRPNRQAHRKRADHPFGQSALCYLLCALVTSFRPFRLRLQALQEFLP